MFWRHGFRLMECCERRFLRLHLSWRLPAEGRNMNKFALHSEYKPTGDQPYAIEKLIKGLESGQRGQTLLGVTGSGKTYTMAQILPGCKGPP